MTHSFTSWVRHRHGMDDVTPEADKIVPLVAAAGTAGMNRKQIGNAIELDRDALDGLLGGMVGIGLLVVVAGADGPIYRTSGGNG